MNRTLPGCFNILGTGHYLAAGGRATMFGGGRVTFSASLWRGHFSKKAFGERAMMILAYKYSVIIHLKSSNSHFSLCKPTVSVLSNYTCKHGALF